MANGIVEHLNTNLVVLKAQSALSRARARPEPEPEPESDPELLTCLMIDQSKPKPLAQPLAQPIPTPKLALALTPALILAWP